MGLKLIRSVAIAWVLVVTGSPVFAQQPSDVDALREEIAQLRKMLEAVEARLAAVEPAPPLTPDTPAGPLPLAQQPVQPPAPLPPPAPVPESAVPAGASKAFNPDTSVIANFVGVAGKNSESNQRSLQLNEVEVAFQADVDPYARADFFLSAGPDGLEIEEGYLTFTTLPQHFLLKVGKMRAQFGKVNPTHTHLMPTVDRPLVTDNLVGGDEGIDDSGISLSRLIANPVLFVEATGEVYGAHSDVFQTNKRSRLNYIGRLRAYRDLSEGSNIDLGASAAYGPTNVGIDTNKRLYGVDATFRYRPLRRAIYRRFQARTELVWSLQNTTTANQRAFGYYGLGEYQFARRWYFGARYDRSQRALDASIRDEGGSAFLTFWPSEFSQLRGQYRRTNYGDGPAANELLFQANFAIGAHAAHAF